MTMGKNIKELRIQHGITQGQLAEKIGVTTAYISMIESGTRENLSLDVFTAIATALNVPLSRLWQ